jgi:hypothetical protein
LVTAFLSLAQPAAEIDNIITKRWATSKSSAELAIQVEKRRSDFVLIFSFISLTGPCPAD